MHMHMHRLFLVLEYLNLKRSRTPFRRAPELRPSQGSSCAVTREAAHNLARIFHASGSKALCRQLVRKYMTID